MKMMRFAVVAASAQVALGSNPLGKVFELMDEVKAKIVADGEAEAKAYKEFVSWCDNAARNAKHDAETAQAAKTKLEASVAKLTSDIEAGSSKIEDLAASISADEAELKEATGVREKEASDFAAAEAELVDGVDTLTRAIGIIEREMAKSGAFTQLDVSSLSKLTSALGTVLDAAAFGASDKTKLMAFVQSQSSDDDDDAGAPAPDAYQTHSTGIVDVLNDMKSKAEAELAELRKTEGNAAHAFAMLKGSLERKIAADNKDMDEEKAAKAAAEQQKAADEGDLDRATKDLANAEQAHQTAATDCMTTAADHEATVAARNEELKVIATAKQILEESTSGAVSQTYGFLQLTSRSDLQSTEVVEAVKRLAVDHHSAALNQLASQISTVVMYGGASSDVFAKIKGLIGDMITKLEKEAESDATEKAYCDEELAKTEAKKAELEDSIAALTGKIDQAASKSAILKEEVAAAQEDLAALMKSQAEMDAIRAEENAAYTQAKADLEAGLAGVQKALGVLREYYGGAAAAAFMQQETGDAQPAVPKHEKQAGAGGSIINILEVCESDFSEDLAKEESAEADAVEQYEKTTQENKVTKALRDQDVKYKTQEFKSLDKEISEYNNDRATEQTELGAVLEYYAQIKDRCIAKPESYEERTKRRNAEIEGLKEALNILESQTAFVQRKSHFLGGHLRA